MYKQKSFEELLSYKIFSRTCNIKGNSIPYFSGKFGVCQLPYWFKVLNLSNYNLKWDNAISDTPPDIIIINEKEKFQQIKEIFPHTKIYFISKSYDLRDIVKTTSKFNYYLADVYLENDGYHVILFKKRSLTSPEWKGEKEVSEKTLFIYSEWGWGDIFRNIRFLLPLKKMFKKVIFECRYELLNLASLYEVDIWHKQSDIPPHDIHVRLEFVHHYIRIFYQKLILDKIKLNEKSNKLNVGVISRGSNITLNSHRNFPIEVLNKFSKIFSFWNFDIFNKCNFAKDILNSYDDWHKTAQLINSMDFMICADTSLAHLSGILGVPTFGILPSQEYPTVLKEKTKLWYPNMTLIKSQKEDWADLSQLLKLNLRQYVKIL